MEILLSQRVEVTASPTTMHAGHFAYLRDTIEGVPGHQPWTDAKVPTRRQFVFVFLDKENGSL
jgi:hypothetical protein